MKTNEFLQTINATIHLSKKIDVTEIYLQADQLRKLHVRLQRTLDYMLIDCFSFESPVEKEKVKAIAQEIRDFAKEYNIQVLFYKPPVEHSEFRNLFREKVFATYWYKNFEITSLIVYHDPKTIKKQMNKKVEQIKEVEFDKDIENPKVLDENGNDLNVIPGIDL